MDGKGVSIYVLKSLNKICLNQRCNSLPVIIGRWEGHGDPTDMRESTSVFQIRLINWSKLDK